MARPHDQQISLIAEWRGKRAVGGEDHGDGEIGEGHISSIEFWSGWIDNDGNITFYPTSNYVETPELQPDKTYDKHHFSMKLNEMGETDEEASQVLDGLDDKFTFEQLQENITKIQSAPGFDLNRESFAIDMVT